jgi:hypothetical protein
MIRKLPSGQYRVEAETTHRNMGTYRTHKAALRRLRQIEFFKRRAFKKR